MEYLVKVCHFISSVVRFHASTVIRYMLHTLHNMGVIRMLQISECHTISNWSMVLSTVYSWRLYFLQISSYSHLKQNSYVRLQIWKNLSNTLIPIYLLTRTQCDSFYMGKTKNSLSTRMNGHRSFSNSPDDLPFQLQSTPDLTNSLLIPVGMYVYSITYPLILITSSVTTLNPPINTFCPLEIGRASCRERV